MTREENRRFNELCEIPVDDMTDADWAEWQVLSRKAEEEYNFWGSAMEKLIFHTLNFLGFVTLFVAFPYFLLLITD